MIQRVVAVLLLSLVLASPLLAADTPSSRLAAAIEQALPLSGTPKGTNPKFDIDISRLGIKSNDLNISVMFRSGEREFSCCVQFELESGSETIKLIRIAPPQSFSTATFSLHILLVNRQPIFRYYTTR